MGNFEVYKSSFKALSDLKDALHPAAIKNKVSPVALILLLALNSGVDLSYIISDEAITELINSGFALMENGAITLTGKGAILAKSLERIL